MLGLDVELTNTWSNLVTSLPGTYGSGRYIGATWPTLREPVDITIMGLRQTAGWT